MLTREGIFEKFGPRARVAQDGFQFDGIVVYAHNWLIDQHKVVWAGEFFGTVGYSNVTEFLDSFKSWCDEQGTWVPVVALLGNSRTGESHFMSI